jgi:hypothetical protein
MKTSTAADLKEVLASKFEIPVDAFYLVRAQNDKEIKEMTRTIDQLNFSHNSMIKV